MCASVQGAAMQGWRRQDPATAQAERGHRFRGPVALPSADGPPRHARDIDAAEAVAAAVSLFWVCMLAAHRSERRLRIAKQITDGRADATATTPSLRVQVSRLPAVGPRRSAPPAPARQSDRRSLPVSAHTGSTREFDRKQCTAASGPAGGVAQ